MNGVAFSVRPSCRNPAASSGSTTKRSTPARRARSGLRGRSVGRPSAGDRPSSVRVQYSSCGCSNLLVEPSALPARDVRVLQGQRRKRHIGIDRRPPSRRSSTPTDQPSDRDVVDGQQQRVVIGGKPQQSGAPGHVTRQIERLRRHAGGYLPNRRLASLDVEARQILNRQRDGAGDNTRCTETPSTAVNTVRSTS